MILSVVNGSWFTFSFIAKPLNTSLSNSYSVRQNKTVANLRGERKAKTGGKKMSTDFEEAVIAFAQSLDARGRTPEEIRLKERRLLELI